MLRTRYAFPIAAFVLAVVALLVLSLVAVAVIRALPGRYAYYLPGPLQELRHNPHPEILPTPISVQASAPPTATPVPILTPAPTVPLTPASTPTLPPASPVASQTPSPMPSPSPEPSPTPTMPVVVALTGIRHEHQGWNNCGPTTLTMLLSYWGCEKTQQDAAPVLKPDPEDKHVGIYQMEAYARDQGFNVITRVNGSLDRLKELLRAGFPVMVETWHVRDARDQLGHYRLVVGYDDTARKFYLYDSLEGPDVSIGYREMDELWRVFNRIYMVVYTTPEEWETVAAILGSDLDDVAMLEQALGVARNEALALPTDCVAYADCADWVTFSWYNVGASLTALGRHEEAAAAYDRARQMGLHFRTLWYQFGPYESYYAVGRHDDVIALANATLATASNLEESYYWRGRARLALGDVEGARSDFTTALRYHEDWPPAASALADLDGS